MKFHVKFQGLFGHFEISNKDDGEIFDVFFGTIWNFVKFCETLWNFQKIVLWIFMKFIAVSKIVKFLFPNQDPSPQPASQPQPSDQ